MCISFPQFLTNSRFSSVGESIETLKDKIQSCCSIGRCSQIIFGCKSICKPFMSNIRFQKQRSLCIFLFHHCSLFAIRIVGSWTWLLWMIGATYKKTSDQAVWPRAKVYNTERWGLLCSFYSCVWSCIFLVYCWHYTNFFFSGYSEYDIDIVPLSYLTKQALLSAIVFTTEA